jgi:hypothetical protein
MLNACSARVNSGVGGYASVSAKMNTNNVEAWIDIIGTLITASAIVAGAAWFLITTRFKQRVQFDLECNFICLKQNDEVLVAELLFVCENKGFIEHRLYNLTVSVHTLESEIELNHKAKTGELVFKRQILPLSTISPEFPSYYFTRPGVRQVIPHIISIPATVSVIRVTASFDYRKLHGRKHRIRRVFKVTSKAVPRA